MSKENIRILITGSNGMLSQYFIRACLQNAYDFFATAASPNRLSFCPPENFLQLDIRNRVAVERAIKKIRPTHILNTAAMTNVDLCEEKVSEAFAINRDGVENIITAIKGSDIHLIQISTDFIFDGNQQSYLETDKAHPLGVYGQSKWEGELAVQNSNHLNYTILRTSLLYGTGENLIKGNIFSWAMAQLRLGKTLTIVNDQYRTPTFAGDLANACIKIIEKRAFGIFNISGGMVQSMYEHVQKVAKYLNKDRSMIQPISTIALNQKANRPKSSGLDITKAKESLGFQPTDFFKTLEFIDPLIQKKNA